MRGIVLEIYIGGIAWETTELEIENLFKKFGTVTKVSIPKDRITDKPRGFGFCVMEDEAQAMSAIAALDKFELHGRQLHVSKAFNQRRRLF